MATRDRATLIAFVTFWAVVAAGSWAGYRAIDALGWAGSHRSVATAARVSGQARTHSRRVAPPALTVDSIFAPQPLSLASYDRRKLRTLIATGDVIPARSVNYRMVTSGDFLYPFRQTAAYLRSGDITLINLEAPLLSAGCPVIDTGMTFCGDPRFVSGLRFAGVDTACTANNHVGNYGDAGIAETWVHLRAAGIGYCGYGRVDHKTVRGVRFAFLAYNCVGARFDYAAARREIRAARRTADVVVVSVHWGKEYVAVPTTAPGIADDDPVRVAHWIIDSGADLIIGNHPHHVQGVELYHHRLITYAHGNFIFDQMFTARSDDCPGDFNRFCSTREGVVGAYTFYGTRLVRVRYRPVVIYDYWQPRWAPPDVARAVLDEMRRSSAELRREGR